MRVLITRPEREATALATALVERGHAPVIAPLFQLESRHPPDDFAARLAACQAVLLTSANGARALAEATTQRSKPILAVGDTTAATAEGLGFASVLSASGDGAALATLVRQRLDPKAGPLLHVSGVDVATMPGPDGFEIDRVPLYEARAATTLPPSAQAALQARALDAATFFSPRAAETFARLVTDAGLVDSCRSVTAITISRAAADPLSALPFKSVVAAQRPTRQAMLDEIDRLATTGVQEAVPARQTMSDMSSSEPPLRLSTPAPEPIQAPPQIVTARRGLGVVGTFIVAVIAAALVLAAALFSMPYWPDEARAMWRGPTTTAAAAPPLSDIRAVETAKTELGARIDDLDKRVRGLANTATQTQPDAGVAALRSRVEALESKPAAPAPSSEAADKDIAALRLEIATLRSTLQALDQSMSGQKDQVTALSDAVDKAKAASTQTSNDEKKALAAARASTAIGIAARLSAALEAGRPFAPDVALLEPLAQDDSKIAEVTGRLKPLADKGVVSRETLSQEFPAMAKAALADDLVDDSFGQRVLGRLKGLVSLRRVGADVPGDTVEAKLARAEAALKAGDVGKAVDLVKSLPPQAARAAKDWLAKAQAHLAAQQAIDQLAALGVGMLGAAR